MRRRVTIELSRLVAVSLGLALIAVSLPANADTMRLRRLQTDQEGNFTVLFSLLDANRDPIVDTRQVPVSALRVAAALEPAGLQDSDAVLDLDEPSIQALKDYGSPFRIFIMLPNQDLFNGTEDNENRPDASGLRGALRQALAAIPQDRSDIILHVALYNDEVRWMPEYNATQVQELSSALLRNEYVAAAGTRVEDPFNAIDNAYRTKLRRQSRPTGSSDFAYFFVIVTSALTEVADAETFSAEVERLRGLFSAPDMTDVTMFTIVYNPVFGPELLHDPNEAPVRFAQVTPQNGTRRIVGTVSDIRTAMRQTLDEIVSSFILRFNNTDLESDLNYHFQMTATLEGEEVESNLIVAHVNPVEVNVWKYIIIVGVILIALVLIAIIVLYILRRPKEEPEEEEVVMAPAVKLCVQCGRDLRADLQYCHHCAAEPNYGLLKVLEGPMAGWTFFLRDNITEIGKAVGNSIIIEGDAGISSHHLKISVQEGSRYLIEDLESTNGTYIENAQVSKQFLKNGDVIAMGTATKLKFTIS